ncbi:hypothetical protein QBC32DRAFT_272074, partial [Pseudoneurospora amorphoporcata]
MLMPEGDDNLNSHFQHNSNPLRFSMPIGNRDSSFYGTPSQVLQHVAAVGATAADPFVDQWVIMGILPLRRRRPRALDFPVPASQALAEPQPRSVSCPHCTLYGRDVANTHELRDCGFASTKGDIPGCPVCNTLDHFYDVCKKRQASSDEMFHEDWRFLVQARSGLPPVRTKTSWPDLAVERPMQPTSGFPITKERAIDVRDDHRHGKTYFDARTRMLRDVRKNLESLRASEVFTGMGSQLVNRASNGTSDSNAMELDDVPATSTASVTAVETAPASLAPISSAAPVATVLSGAPASSAVPAFAALAISPVPAATAAPAPSAPVPSAPAGPVVLAVTRTLPTVQ